VRGEAGDRERPDGDDAGLIDDRRIVAFGFVFVATALVERRFGAAVVDARALGAARPSIEPRGALAGEDDRRAVVPATRVDPEATPEFDMPPRDPDPKLAPEPGRETPSRVRSGAARDVSGIAPEEAPEESARGTVNGAAERGGVARTPVPKSGERRLDDTHQSSFIFRGTARGAQRIARRDSLETNGCA
jgi:hypothetical protein